MFCPEDGTHIPHTDSIHDRHPIYDCPQCHETWVYDTDERIYANYPNRAQALVAYEAGEVDVARVAPPSPAVLGINELCPGCMAGEEHTHAPYGLPEKGGTA